MRRLRRRGPFARSRSAAPSRRAASSCRSVTLAAPSTARAIAVPSRRSAARSSAVAVMASSGDQIAALAGEEAQARGGEGGAHGQPGGTVPGQRRCVRDLGTIEVPRWRGAQPCVVVGSGERAAVEVGPGVRKGVGEAPPLLRQLRSIAAVSEHGQQLSLRCDRFVTELVEQAQALLDVAIGGRRVTGEVGDDAVQVRHSTRDEPLTACFGMPPGTLGCSCCGAEVPRSRAPRSRRRPSCSRRRNDHLGGRRCGRRRSARAANSSRSNGAPAAARRVIVDMSLICAEATMSGSLSVLPDRDGVALALLPRPRARPRPGPERDGRRVRR